METIATVHELQAMAVGPNLPAQKSNAQSEFKFTVILAMEKAKSIHINVLQSKNQRTFHCEPGVPRFYGFHEINRSNEKF